MREIRALGAGLLDLLFPPRCFACAAYGAAFCAACRARIEPAQPIPAPPGLAEIAAAGSHSGVLRQAVLELKFSARLALVEPLGELIAEVIAERWDDWQPQALVPVPIHWTRRLWRGFNQSDLLCGAAARRQGVRMCEALVRTRRTPPQVGRSAEQRRANVQAAFRVRDAFAHRRVVLIDDVCTTGATLGACAAALRRAGAERIYAVTVTSDAIGGRAP